MTNGKHRKPFFLHLVDYSVIAGEKFSYAFVVGFRDNTTAFRKVLDLFDFS